MYFIILKIIPPKKQQQTNKQKQGKKKTLRISVPIHITALRLDYRLMLQLIIDCALLRLSEKLLLVIFRLYFHLARLIVHVFEMLQDIIALFVFILRATVAYSKAVYRLFVSPSKVSVRGRVIVITGSGSGLGRELALRLAAEGARLALWDISDAGNKKTAELIQTKLPEAELHLYTVDVTNKDLVKTSALRVRSEVDDVYMLINNAGVLVGESLLELRDDDIRRTIEINLLSAFWTLRAFLPGMLESNSGHIVTTCSTGGQNAMHRLTDYCASKFGILGLDEALESELRDVHSKTGIKQTLICPHFLDTGMIHSVAARGSGMNRTEEAADYIADGILRQKRYVYFPKIFTLAATVKEMLPHEGRLALLDFIQTQVPSQSVNRPHED